ncbi:MAG: hypothetical protein JXB88_24850 [Spirochaetales bacterium]|nr:hypothetical protein [Spirochaetales bacterium]
MNSFKKIKFIQCVLYVLLFFFIAQGIPAQDMTGDVNGDSFINIVDALLTAQFYVGLAPAPFNEQTADVDCSGEVDIVDALLIARYYVGLIEQFPCSEPTPTPVITLQPTQPEKLILLGKCETGIGHRENWTNAIAVGNYLYVTTKRGIKIFSVPDMNNPVFIKDTDICKETVFLYMESAGNLIFALDDLDDDLYIIDVTNPLEPVVVSTIDTYKITDFAYKDHYLFLAASDYLTVFTISDPALPVEVTRLSEKSAALFLRDTILFSIIDDNTISDDFKIFNVSSPGNPLLIASVDQEGSDIAVSGDYAYIRFLSKLRIYNISDSYNPFMVFPLTDDGTFFYSNQGYYPQSIYPVGSILLYARPGGLVPVDISSVTAPGYMEFIRLPGYSSEDNYRGISIMLTKGKLLITYGDETYGSGIKYADFTVPSAPAFNDYIDACGYAYTPFLISPETAYIADGMGGIKVIDVTDPGNPVAEKIIDGDILIDFTRSGNYLYGLDSTLMTVDSTINEVVEQTSPIDISYINNRLLPIIIMCIFLYSRKE